MKSMIAGLVCLVAMDVVGSETIPVPWQEFKTLYRQSIEREIIEKARPQESDSKEPFVYTIDEGVYRLSLGRQQASGSVLLNGTVLSGHPERIPLFGPDLVVTGVEKISGGRLVNHDSPELGTAFLPDGSNDFQVVIAFMVSSGEDERSRLAAFSIPPAVRNSLEIELEEGMRLVGEPGIPGPDNRYHFPGQATLSVRYDRQEKLTRLARPEIDAFTRVRLQAEQALITTVFVPLIPTPEVLSVQAPPEARFVNSSLKSSRVRALTNGTYELRLPPGTRQSFSLEFALAPPGPDEDYAFVLPVVRESTGSQDNFTVEEPENAHITLDADGSLAKLPWASLPRSLQDQLVHADSYTRAPSSALIRLQVRRLAGVHTPPVVVDRLDFFTSFEDSGGILSTIVMDVPAGSGGRLTLDAVADARIWYLTVNGRRQEVYTDNGDTWIIPLDADKVSQVELAFLRPNTALKLQGRLDALLPATGLPCRNVRVGIALPERVELLSMEGPVSPTDLRPEHVPRDFKGNPHYFSRSFYEGDGMALAVSYKEPTRAHATD